MLSGWLPWPSAKENKEACAEHRLGSSRMVLVVAAGVEDEESDVERTKRGDGQLPHSLLFRLAYSVVKPRITPYVTASPALFCTRQ